MGGFSGMVSNAAAYYGVHLQRQNSDCEVARRVLGLTHGQ